MSYILPTESYGSDPIVSVPVIASYDAEGHVKPLFIRINNEKYKVENYWVRASSGNNMDYNVTLSRNNITYRLKLTYHLRETIWSVSGYLTMPTCT